MISLFPHKIRELIYYIQELKMNISQVYTQEVSTIKAKIHIKWNLDNLRLGWGSWFLHYFFKMYRWMPICTGDLLLPLRLQEVWYLYGRLLTGPLIIISLVLFFWIGVPPYSWLRTHFASALVYSFIFSTKAACSLAS